MRHLLATLIVIGTVIPTVALATPAGSTGGVPAQVSAKKQCQSKACHKRVAIKKKQRIRAGCDSVKCKRRVAEKQIVRRKLAIVAPYRAWLARTRACESGGNYSTATGNGFYGAYQFVIGTWYSVGGTGNPANASKLEQDYRAVLLLKRSGAGQWPVCGR